MELSTKEASMAPLRVSTRGTTISNFKDKLPSRLTHTLAMHTTVSVKLSRVDSDDTNNKPKTPRAPIYR